METHHLDFDITPQPDETTCGPACLHAVYRYYGDDIPVEKVMAEVPQVAGGGTLTVFLGIHALRRGYEVTIYTCDLHWFDPSWFHKNAPPLRECLAAQIKAKRSPRLREGTQAYIELLDLGGRIYMEDITVPLLSSIVNKGTPIITGLCATWLYQSRRERPDTCVPDDIGGEPVGHFVVVHGIDVHRRTVKIADPNYEEPYPASHVYEVPAVRVLGAIMLGIVTNDAKLLVVTPKRLN